MSILIKNAVIVQSGDTAPISGSIAIEGGFIKHVGEVPENFAAQKVIDGKGFIAMPGLVNAHTHSPMGLLRNMADDLPFADWLFGKIIPAENKLSEEDIYWGALLGVAEMIKSGTTCFLDMYIHMDSVARAVSETGIRASLSYGPITSGVRGGGLIVDSEKCEKFIKKWNTQDGKIKCCMEIHSVYLFDGEYIEEAARLANRLNTVINIHLSESDAEIAMSMEKYGTTPVEAAYNLGVFNAPAVAAHCVKLNVRDIEILSKSGVSPAHCPTSNLKLGNGVSPVPALLDAGLNVCLGTDGCASNNNLNMFEEMHLAALLHKGINANPALMPTDKVINMATVNGANALGFGGEGGVGGIYEGFKADIILIDAQKPHMCPLNSAKAAIVYSAQAGDVDTVIVDGDILMSGGRLTNMDEELIKHKAREISERLPK